VFNGKIDSPRICDRVLTDVEFVAVECPGRTRTNRT